MEDQYGLWLPVNISTHGGQVDTVITVLHWFMAALFVGWGIYFIYCLIRFRRGANPRASHDLIKGKPARYVEVAVIIIEAGILVGLSMPLWASFKTDFPDESESVVVRVVAEQFAWNVHYPGPDGVFGRTLPDLITSDNLLGLDPDDPDGKDDFNAVNQLHIPVNKPVIVYLSSKDVIHSFKIPVIRLTQDVIPGTTNKVWFEATKTGNFDIACAQLCGLGHYRMRGRISVESSDQFQAWLQEKQDELSGDDFAF